MDWIRFSNPLITSQDTRRAEREVRRAAREKFGKITDAFYEHGQWWVRVDDGQQECTYSAVDTSTGVDFELIDCLEQNPYQGRMTEVGPRFSYVRRQNGCGCG